MEVVFPLLFYFLKTGGMQLKNCYILLAFIFIVALTHKECLAQGGAISEYFPEINILESNGPAEGEFFFGAKGITATGASLYISIIDNYGTPVFFRKTNNATASMRLLDDGRIGYMFGVPRKLIFLDSLMEISERFAVQGCRPNPHDWDVSKDGNVLLMGESSRTVDMSQYVEGGNPSAEVLDLVVQEFDNEQNLVFSWNSAEHFEITDANENSPYVDFTESQLDYVHANSICYDSDTSFLISSRHMDEITKVDLRTGDIIWRMGGKRNQFQFFNDTIGFSHQHCIRKLENGNLLFFDNGNLHNPQLSSVIEYDVDEVNKIATLVKRLYRTPAVYSNHEGKVQRLSNGNTLVSWGPYWPSFTEFFPDGTIATEWDYTEHSFAPRIEKYMWKTKVFESNVDTVDFGNWVSDSLFQNLWFKNNSPDSLKLTTVESRSTYFGIYSELPVTIASGDSVNLNFWFNPEGSGTGYFEDVLTIASDSENQRIARQINVFGRKQDNSAPVASLETGTEEVPLDVVVVIQLSEPVKTVEGVLDYNSVDSYIILKESGIDGANVAFNASINSEKNTIYIVPDSKLEKARTYIVSLKSGIVDYSGNELDAFEETFNTILTSAVSIEKKEWVRVYPNPVTSKLMVQMLSNIGGFRMSLLNSNGVVVGTYFIREGNTREEIDVSSLSKGIYLLVGEFNNRKIIRKIIKN